MCHCNSSISAEDTPCTEKGPRRQQKNDILFCWGTSLEENQAEQAAHLLPFALFCVAWCLSSGALHALWGFWAGAHHHYLTEEATGKQMQSHCPSHHIISPCTPLPQSSQTLLLLQVRTTAHLADISMKAPRCMALVWVCISTAFQDHPSLSNAPCAL